MTEGSTSSKVSELCVFSTLYYYSKWRQGPWHLQHSNLTLTWKHRELSSKISAFVFSPEQQFAAYLPAFSSPNVALFCENCCTTYSTQNMILVSKAIKLKAMFSCATSLVIKNVSNSIWCLYSQTDTKQPHCPQNPKSWSLGVILQELENKQNPRFEPSPHSSYLSLKTSSVAIISHHNSCSQQSPSSQHVSDHHLPYVCYTLPGKGQEYVINHSHLWVLTLPHVRVLSCF